MFEPLISVVINCYNGEKFIDKSIQSVLRQTYNKWELVFWDNASSDNSSKIYNTYKKSDKRLKYFRSAVHEKLYKARKRAIEKCRGEYFAFLDVDDWWKETKLETQIKTFLNTIDPENSPLNNLQDYLNRVSQLKGCRDYLSELHYDDNGKTIMEGCCQSCCSDDEQSCQGNV